MQNSQLQDARKMLGYAQIFGIIGGVVAMFYTFFVGGIIGIVLAIILGNYRKLSDEELAQKKTTILIFGLIMLILTTLIGGIFALVAYSKIPDAATVAAQPQSNMMSLEKAFDLKEKGAISQEEYDKIKSQSLK